MKNLKYILFSILLCFIYINNVNAATCVYTQPSNFQHYKYTITCKTGSKCTINDPNNQITINSSVTNPIIGDTCPDNIYTESANSEITNISLSGTNDNKHPINRSLSTEGNSTNPNNPTKPNENPSTPSTTPDDGKFNADTFCKGSVQGVFTTLGWVFFIVKILIPIILIIFGSIDVAKAVIASKDDEIKKSVKTLAVRAIAGIIIFFVPTLLNFVVKMIDDNDVYNGTFWDCTKCMLDPTDESVCSSLRGNE